MTGREYAAVLREAVEFFDAHPYLPVPDGARNLPLYYEDPSPAEVRWLISIVADEGFKIQSSSAGLDFWVKKLTKCNGGVSISATRLEALLSLQNNEDERVAALYPHARGTLPKRQLWVQVSGSYSSAGMRGRRPSFA